MSDFASSLLKVEGAIAAVQPEIGVPLLGLTTLAIAGAGIYQNRDQLRQLIEQGGNAAIAGLQTIYSAATTNAAAAAGEVASRPKDGRYIDTRVIGGQVVPVTVLPAGKAGDKRTTSATWTNGRGAKITGP